MSESAELQRAVENLTGTIERLRDDLVRKDVYAVDQRLTYARIDNVAEDVSDLSKRVDKTEERRAADRRFMLTGIAVPVLLMLIQIYLSAQTGAPS